MTVRRGLDLFCKQGGATRGYQLAGFTMHGVDIEYQSKYCGDSFTQHDAIQFVRDRIKWIRDTFEFIHASPPCQLYSITHRINESEYPDLIGQTREVLERVCLPYVIENVEGARSLMSNPRTLCGTMFGMRTYRHRLFEFGWGLEFEPPEHHEHVAPQAKMGRRLLSGEFYHAVGNFPDVALVREDMGMPWADRSGIAEAVPPAYTEFIGQHIH